MDNVKKFREQNFEIISLDLKFEDEKLKKSKDKIVEENKMTIN